jgi:hypothetical protein
LFEDGSWAIENFADDNVSAELNGKPVAVAARAWGYEWK